MKVDNQEENGNCVVTSPSVPGGSCQITDLGPRDVVVVGEPAECRRHLWSSLHTQSHWVLEGPSLFRSPSSAFSPVGSVASRCELARASHVFLDETYGEVKTHQSLQQQARQYHQCGGGAGDDDVQRRGWTFFLDDTHTDRSRVLVTRHSCRK